MASSIPSQTRAVDPFASYNSNVVNDLTGIVTRGSNVIDYYNAVQVVPDSTSVTDHVEVVPGTVYKDDVLIDILASHRVDFTDPNQYVSASGNPMGGEDGIYYVVLEYTYTKSRPAPQAYIKILLPSQRPGYISGDLASLLFLKAVEVMSGSIIELYDYDPENTEIQREHVRNYASSDANLPTFNQLRDQGRLTYISTEDQYYFGYETGWGAVGEGSSFIADTSGFEIGDLVYVTGAGTLAKAIGPTDIASSDGVVVTTGTTGVVQSFGGVSDVKVETGVTVSVGDILYLSNSVAGTITNVRTNQFVGRCTELIDSTSINALFVRGDPIGAGVDTISKYGTLAGGAWLGVDPVYQDLDTTDFGGVVMASFALTSTGYQLQPADFEYISATVSRVYMPAGFASNVTYLLIGPKL